jgi:hypothetical protein
MPTEEYTLSGFNALRSGHGPATLEFIASRVEKV